MPDPSTVFALTIKVPEQASGPHAAATAHGHNDVLAATALPRQRPTIASPDMP